MLRPAAAARIDLRQPRSRNETRPYGLRSFGRIKPRKGMGGAWSTPPKTANEVAYSHSNIFPTTSD